MPAGLGLEPQALGMPRSELGEGPVWLADQARLAWVDIAGHIVHSVDPYRGRGTHQSVRFDEAVTCLAPADGSRFIAGTSSGVALINEEGAVTRVATTDNARTRMNDGRCDPLGQFIVGSTGLDFDAGLGSLYALVAPGELVSLLTGVTISNGLAWADHETLFYIDSPTHRIDILDYDAASPAVHRRGVLVDLPEEWGLPDGMCIDAEGNLWVGFWGGGAIRTFSPDGILQEVTRLPVDRVTSCTFGGPELRDLFITTARSRPSHTVEGDVFVVETPVVGQPAVKWRGFDA